MCAHEALGLIAYSLSDTRNVFSVVGYGVMEIKYGVIDGSYFPFK